MPDTKLSLSRELIWHDCYTPQISTTELNIESKWGKCLYDFNKTTESWSSKDRLGLSRVFLGREKQWLNSDRAILLDESFILTDNWLLILFTSVEVIGIAMIQLKNDSRLWSLKEDFTELLFVVGEWWFRLTRKQRDYEMETDRLLSRNIIKTWKEIKCVRQTNNYTNTPLKLTIRKSATFYFFLYNLFVKIGFIIIARAFE